MRPVQVRGLPPADRPGRNELSLSCEGSGMLGSGAHFTGIFSTPHPAETGQKGLSAGSGRVSGKRRALSSGSFASANQRFMLPPIASGS
jgi:hypothetical protein